MYSSQENYEKVYAKRFIQSSQFCQSSYPQTVNVLSHEVAREFGGLPIVMPAKPGKKVRAGLKPALTTQF
jgi:hypothetical protein